MKTILYLFVVLFLSTNFTSCTPTNIQEQNPLATEECCDEDSDIPPPPPPPPGDGD